MKYLIAALLMVVSVSANATIVSKVICEEGYKFLIVYDNSITRPPTVVQIFRAGTGSSRPPQPISCK